VRNQTIFGMAAVASATVAAVAGSIPTKTESAIRGRKVALIIMAGV